MYLNDMECKMYGECGMYEMYLLETILVKGNFIYFNEQSLYTFKSLIYHKSITVIKIDTSKVGVSRSLVRPNSLHKSV